MSEVNASQLLGAFDTPITERIPWAKSKDEEVPLHLEYTDKSMVGKVREIVDKYPGYIAYEFMGRKTT